MKRSLGDDQPLPEEKSSTRNGRNQLASAESRTQATQTAANGTPAEGEANEEESGNSDVVRRDTGGSRL